MSGPGQVTGVGQALVSLALIAVGSALLVFRKRVERFWEIVPGFKNRLTESDGLRQYVRLSGPIFLIVVGVLGVIGSLLSLGR